MMKSLQGKVALVTGSARRIGAETVRALHQEGANVVVHYHQSVDPACELADELNQLRPNSCHILQADLTDHSQLKGLIDEVVSHFGHLDVLVNNASSFYPTPMGEVTEQQWDDLMGTNFKAPFFLSQLAAPQLRKNRGVIINMVDIHAYRPLKNYPVYTMAKAGLMMLTHSLALELGSEIRVNGVAPGAILWPEQGNHQADDADGILARTALKREGEPTDIADAIVYLVTRANYVTGHILPVDGGRLLNQ